MKKLLIKDKKLCLKVASIENQHYSLKCIIKNFNFFLLIRWNASLKLTLLQRNNSKNAIVNRCLQTVNKKRFNRLTTFSRHVFLKLIRQGLINGIQKASW